MKRLLVGVAVLLLVSGQLFAQDSRERGFFGIGPQVGFYKAAKADDGKFMGGVAMRLKLSDALGVEGSVSYRQEEYQNGLVTVTSWPVMVTGLIYPLPIIYGAIGAGWYNTKYEYDLTKSGFLGGPVTADLRSGTNREFGWHFGGGVELPLGTRASLVGDLRYVFLNYNFKAFPGSNNVDANFYVISAQLLFGL